MCLLSLAHRSRTANLAPTALALSANTYAVPPTANQVVGTLSTTDINCCQTFTYSIVGGANAALFAIAGNALQIVNAGQSGNGLQVTVRTTDSGTGALWFQQTFTIDEGEAESWLPSQRT